MSRPLPVSRRPFATSGYWKGKFPQTKRSQPMSKKSDAAEFKRVRADIAEMLGYRADKLTTAQALRVDGVLALKVALDEMRAKLFRGEQIDHAKMLSLSEAIERYLPVESKPDPTPAIYKQNPRTVLENMVRRWVAADEAEKAERIAAGAPANELEVAQARIDALERELAELRGMLPAADPALLLAPERAIDVPTSAILPPSEQADRPENQRYRHGGQDNPKAPVTIDHEGKPLRPGSQMLPDGRIVPIPPKALSGDETKRRMAKSNSDRAALHRGMTAPSRVSGEPQPSSPMTTYGDSGFIWGGDKRTGLVDSNELKRSDCNGCSWIEQGDAH